MKVVLGLIALLCMSSTAFADTCNNQGVEVAKKLMKLNREKFSEVNIDQRERVVDQGNTDDVILSITGRDSQGKLSTLGYKITLAADGCILTRFEMQGRN